MIPKTKTICCSVNGRAVNKERLFFKLLAQKEKKKREKNKEKKRKRKIKEKKNSQL